MRQDTFFIFSFTTSAEANVIRRERDTEFYDTLAIKSTPRIVKNAI